MNDIEILPGVQTCIAQVIDIDPAIVVPDAVIIDELGADSLDLLELTFLLQQTFHIKVSPRDIERRIKEKLGDTPLEIDGVYTAEGLRELKAAMPEIPAEEFVEDLTVAELPRKFRVTTMVNLVKHLLEEQNG